MTSPGDRIVLTSPTFDGYPILAQMARLISVSVPLDEHGHHDLDALADAASTAKVVVLCRPHNPTGTLGVGGRRGAVPAACAVGHRRAARRGVHRVRRTGAPTRRVDLVQRFPNVVVLRTFSKAYGLAGLRIGYGFGAPELARSLWTMQLPFGIGITSAVAVAATYDAESQLQQRIRYVTAERRYLQRRLRSMGIYSTDSHANFVYLPRRRRSWRQQFDAAGVRARHYADGGVRVTVGAGIDARGARRAEHLNLCAETVFHAQKFESGVRAGVSLGVQSGLPALRGQRLVHATDGFVVAIFLDHSDDDPSHPTMTFSHPMSSVRTRHLLLSTAGI